MDGWLPLSSESALGRLVVSFPVFAAGEGKAMAASGGADGGLPDRYVVSRPIYNEPSFQEENEKKSVVPKTLRERVRKSCR